MVIAAIDLGFTRWDFAKRMRMSKRDVKDEHKNREGDPRIRSRIRELRKEMLKRSKSVAKVPEADVLITNPTRIAVALSYRHGRSGAPQVVAKGAGDLARKMREVAGAHQIPVVQNRHPAGAVHADPESVAGLPDPGQLQLRVPDPAADVLSSRAGGVLDLPVAAAGRHAVPALAQRRRHAADPADADAGPGDRRHRCLRRRRQCRVGLVVFLILIVVQYVVVTNGAQRVSEVAARFTLDSMPGQQMSIDADLNMGFIDQAEAQRRRRSWNGSRFYGAMDGASASSSRATRSPASSSC
jgi:hypothetical protein